MGDIWTVVFVVALVCAAIGSAIGGSKGRIAEGFFLGFLLGVIGLVVIVLLGPSAQHVEAGHKRCPRCAELIQPAAMVCRYCGAEMAA